MATTTERAARCDRATLARISNSQPAQGSRNRSIAQRRRRAKSKRRKVALLAAMVAVIIASIFMFSGRSPTEQPAITGLPATSPLPSRTPVSEQPTASLPAVRYALTDSERDTVERVVMAEAGGEPLEGQMLVAQCILNGSEKLGIRPDEAVEKYKYTASRPDPTQSVRDAVAAVFDKGETVTDEPVLYFYNPALVRSDFHESQIFVIEVGGHRFFAERSPEE